MKKHILIISQYFYPEQFRINDICNEWIKRGYEVTVVTGIPNYPKGKFFEGYGLFKQRKSVYNGAKVIRIPIIPRGNNVVLLTLNYFSFVISGFFWNLFTKVKADYVFNFETSPMTQALVAVRYSKKHKIPCYIYVQDLWPENVEIITGIKSRLIIGPIEKMVRHIYKNCAAIFATSKSFVKSINSRGIPLDKIEFIPQYAEDFFKQLNKKSIDLIPDDSAFNIVFTGNIGQAQGLEVLPKAAEIVKNKYTKKEIRYNIVGDGRFKNELLGIVDSCGAGDVFSFIPRQPAESIPEILAACDAAFLSLSASPIFEMTIPAKLQTYMACGMPVIACAAGETEMIISTSKCGVCAPPGNAEMLADKIIEVAEKSDKDLIEIGKNALKYYNENFDKKMILEKFDKYFNN